MTLPAENGASSPAERRAGKEARDEHSNPHTKGEDDLFIQPCANGNPYPVLTDTPAPAAPVRERPMLFSAPMVRALLAGTKAQTRRIVKPQPTDYPASERSIAPQALRGEKPKHPAPYMDRYARTDRWCWWDEYDRQGPDWIRCPYGVPGDLLWVKETLRRAPHAWTYGADGAEVAYPGRASIAGLKREVITSIHCRRDCSRLTLRITDVRVERLNDCSEDDATAEGTQEPSLVPILGAFWSSRDGYARLWEHINGAGSWAANPWVWVVSFERVGPAESRASDACPREAELGPGRDR